MSPTDKLFGKKLELIIKSKLGLKEVDYYKPLKDQADMDSLDFAELIMEIEDEFDVIIHDDDFRNLKSLDNFVQYIKSKA